MTSLTLNIPDELAEKARQAGLLDAEKVIKLLEQAIANPVSEPVRQRKPDPRLTNTVQYNDDSDLTEPTSNPGDWELD